MEFEWDENKRLANLAKHGIDFVDATAIWQGEPLDPYAQNRVGGESVALRSAPCRTKKVKRSSLASIPCGKVACASSALGQRGVMSEKSGAEPTGGRVNEGQTDWQRLRTMTDEQNEANIAADFDSWPVEDQARGYFFHVHEVAGGRWSWDMVDPASRIVARAPLEYESRDAAEAAARRLQESLKAA